MVSVLFACVFLWLLSAVPGSALELDGNHDIARQSQVKILKPEDSSGMGCGVGSYLPFAAGKAVHQKKVVTVSRAHIFLEGIQAEMFSPSSEWCRVLLFINHVKHDETSLFRCDEKEGYVFPKPDFDPGPYQLEIQLSICSGCERDHARSSEHLLSKATLHIEVLSTEDFVLSCLPSGAMRGSLQPVELPDTFQGGDDLEIEASKCDSGHLCSTFYTSVLHWDGNQEHGVDWTSFRYAVKWPINQTAMVIVDAWDDHWCSGYSGRSKHFLRQIGQFAHSARESGVLIIHSPSLEDELNEDYDIHPSRHKVKEALRSNPDVAQDEFRGNDNYKFHEWNLPKPLKERDANTGSKVCCPSGENVMETEFLHSKNWVTGKRSRDFIRFPQKQAADIFIDPNRDAIVRSDDGTDLVAFLLSRGIHNLLYAGFASNMCMIHRNSGLVSMRLYGFETVLLQDLTEVHYNPMADPFVNIDQARQIQVEYVRKFISPTTFSGSMAMESADQPKQ